MVDRSREARAMRGIKDEGIVHFFVEGREVVLTRGQVIQGVEVEGIYVKNSIIAPNCNLLRGSRIENSVLNNATGRIIAKASYIELSP